jgi:3-hydroxyacyl-CoA dehydrogenase
MADVALDLLAQGVADAATIDLAWKKTTGMQLGPLGSLDFVGLDTSLAIRRKRLQLLPNDEKLKRGIKVLEELVASGRLGMKTKQGFFSY